ncbi:KP4 killer toxin [Fusarium mexicanum]|uniref:KP4 killer toxin n=1 Tax=Fusarium mexicanum TaxID=751941 RepID=A0A8H5J925_9HYPO|nr:KP4 killer toxin [Fusarium mexicanum]
MHFTTLLASAALALGVSAEGINCHGSSNCANLNDNKWYYNGQHIACWQNVAGTGFCAFLQNTGGLPGKDIKRLLQERVNHGCAKCGSVPAFYSSDNDLKSHGMLTVNYVAKPNCNGIC